LHVTCLGGLDRGINETFSTGDCMEEKLGCTKARMETISDETFGRWFFGFLVEVGKRSVLKTIRDTITTDNLLPNTSYHLGHVNLGTCVFIKKVN
jgi:hypothetical protein